MSDIITFQYMVYGSLVIAYLATAIGFTFLNDIGQMVIQAPRDFYITAFKWRKELMYFSIVVFLFALTANYITPVMSGMAVSINLVLFIPFFISAFLLVKIMFPPKNTGANFVSITEANQHIKDDDTVWAVEINGDAHAYPHQWLAQPHIIGDEVGGEEIVMTFCDLSHLGSAYNPYINDQKVELHTFTQIQCNLILYDRKTDELIQQIHGATEGTGKQMQRYPTQVMPYASFKKLYPDGLVLHNPPVGIKDRIVLWALLIVDAIQHDRDKPPAFPTIDLEDPGLKQLHPKDLIWAVNIADEQVAYTFDYFEQNNWIINTQVGGKDIVLVYYPEYRTVSGFERNINGQLVTITDMAQIDVHGNTEHGKLIRIPVASEVFWMVWYTYYPDTELKK